MSDHGYLLIQAIFQALQLYSWGFALIKLFRNKCTNFFFDNYWRLHGTAAVAVFTIAACGGVGNGGGGEGFSVHLKTYYESWITDQ